ncbi:hypothetical protein BOTBODRAFT_34934 [Botryobasidium botryosum FD-172 SS1]|uniref:RING-type domain-containing protein n=1 Tax=Botryobasidium botryosum (strain FD-172 SS1) TaxID=930990 RepID=A0A067M8I6_BOTB1|nr:hypothetical protein BOTBODRAFT_34934 [Botryobasidium botryosum FD-172 SS1]
MRALIAGEEPDVSAGLDEETFTCGICFDVSPEDWAAKVDRCGHQYCPACMSAYMIARFEERRASLVCPVCSATDDETDPGVIGEDIARQVGLTTEYQQWNRLRLADALISAQCPNCNRTIKVNRGEYERTGKVSCFRMSCRDYQCGRCSTTVRMNEKHKCRGLFFLRFWRKRVRDDTAKLDKLMKKRDWKRCPGCQTPVEKTMGCDHMTCITPECKAHFCYRCGELIPEPDYDHDCF